MKVLAYLFIGEVLIGMLPFTLFIGFLSVLHIATGWAFDKIAE